MRGAYAIIWSISSDNLNARFKASHHRLMTGFGYSNTQLSSQAPPPILWNPWILLNANISKKG